MLNIIFKLFPLFHLILIGSALVWFIADSNIYSLLSIPIAIYFVPLFIYRTHCLIWPLKKIIQTQNYVAYERTLCLQLTFSAIHLFEYILGVIPGAFSWWLRLWGSKIGKNIFWGPGFIMMDRGFLRVGDSCFFGSGICMIGHVASPSRDDLRVYLANIHIGNQVFIGGESRIAPGVQIDSGVVIPYRTMLEPKRHITLENQKEIFHYKHPDSSSNVKNPSS